MNGKDGGATETDGLDEETEPESVDKGPRGDDVGEPASVDLAFFFLDNGIVRARDQGLLKILLLSHALLRIGDGDGGVNFGGHHCGSAGMLRNVLLLGRERRLAASKKCISQQLQCCERRWWLC